MDFDKWLKSMGMDTLELSADQKSNLKKEFDAKVSLESKTKTQETTITQLNKDLDFQKNENKTAYEKRDGLNKKVKELEKKLEDGGTNIDFKNEYHEQKSKVTELEGTITSLNTQITQLNDKYSKLEDNHRTIQESRTNELIQKLPEGDIRDFGETLKDDFDKLQKYVSLHSNGHEDEFNPDQTKSGGKFKIDPSKKWDDYSFAERDKIHSQNPAHFQKLQEEHNADLNKANSIS